jgi:hypothetical protein
MIRSLHSLSPGTFGKCEGPYYVCYRIRTFCPPGSNFEQFELKIYLPLQHLRPEKAGEKAVRRCLEFCWPTTTMLSAICCK